MNLAEVIAEGAVAPRPSVGARDDGAGLLYPGKTHTLSAEPEAGKTWVALHLCAQEILKGESVVFLDYEDGATSVAMRLRALGLTAEQIEQWFVYIRPLVPLSPSDRGGLVTLLTERAPSLVVVDGMTEALETEGLSLLDNSDVATFFRILPSPIADMGPAVLILDHEVKRKADRGRYGLGAGHKLAAVSGAAFKLDSKKSFGVGRTGRSHLTVAKDRHGQLRRRILGPVGEGLYGEVVVNSTAEDIIDVTISAHPGEAVREHALSAMQSQILTVIANEQLTKMTEIYDRLPGNAAKKGQALNALLNVGQVVKDEGGFYTAARSTAL